MKNIIWVILGIVVLVVILLVIKKDPNQTGQSGSQNSSQEGVPTETNKVFVNESGQQLTIESKLKSTKLNFSSVGIVTMDGNPTASGVEYTSNDGTLVFLDRGTSGTLSQNGTVIFSGEVKASN